MMSLDVILITSFEIPMPSIPVVCCQRVAAQPNRSAKQEARKQDYAVSSYEQCDLNRLMIIIGFVTSLFVSQAEGRILSDEVECRG